MFKKILFFADFSENSHWAFTCALNLAKTFHAKLLVLHVTWGPRYPEQLLFYLPPEKLEEKTAFKMDDIKKNLNTHYLQEMEDFEEYEILLREGFAFYEIIQMAKKESVDLIVMGTYRKKGIEELLFGSTAEKVLKESPCPVLIAGLRGKRYSMLRMWLLNL
jgi:nucleotide-binding universal stress UspA family protein